MPKSEGWFNIVIVAAVSCIVAWGAPLPQMKIGIPIMRSRVVRSTMPEFPRSSVAKDVKGVVVVDVTVNPLGRVAEIEILEAPDEATGTAVQRAVGEWQFLPIKATQPVLLRSRLVFYFRIMNRKPIVIDAAAEYLKTHPIRTRSAQK